MKLSYLKLPDFHDGGNVSSRPGVFVLTGDQDLLRELAVETITHHALGDERTPFNHEKFDGEEVDGGQVVASANLLPMLGGVRVVVVRRAQRLLEKSKVADMTVVHLIKEGVYKCRPLAIQMQSLAEC